IVAENGSVKVHLVGGKRSLPSARINDVLAAARSVGTATVVKRYGDGVGRYALASQIAATVRETYVTRNGTEPPVVLVANGADAKKFFDALALSPIAASKGFPILLTRADVLPSETAASLKAMACGTTAVAGGKYTVSASVLAEIKSCTGGTVERWSGRTRYDTAVAVADKAVAEGWLARNKVMITAKLPDALSGGSMLGRFGAVLLLTEPSTLSRPTDLWLLDEHDYVEECYLFGGANSIKSGAERRVRHCLR
ncbi:MAG: cell wall-binding repeat-containing protein, partial [Coriobacteriia bacterium]|nr:cell wall-binding repeat-containing protein [Coriobacteriia bacterium]